MMITRRSAMKILIPLGVIGAFLGGKEVIKYKEKNNKKIKVKSTICLGDSITGSSDWPEKMQKKIGGVVHNYGIGGTTISKSTEGFDSLSLYRIAEAISSGDWSTVVSGGEVLKNGGLHLDFSKTILNLSNTNWNDVDYLVLFYGTNDFGNNFKIGSKGTSGNDTVIGAMNHSIKLILTKYPKIRLLFVSPMWRSRFIGEDARESDLYPNKNGDYLIQYVDAIIETSMENKIPIVDMYRTSGINAYTGSTFLADGLHPTDAGAIRIAEKISSALTYNY